MKKYLLLLAASCLMVLSLQAAVSKTVICTAGSLSSILTNTELSTVTDLIITGTIDARDFKTMRDNMPLLAVLNISNVIIARYTGTEGTISAGSFTYPANAIPDYSFYKKVTNDINGDNISKESLTSITLPSSVTIIGEMAFYGCSGITGTLTIPSSVILIDASAFERCSGLTGILTIPSSITTIRKYAFSSCGGLTSIVIPSSVNSLEQGAFMSCKAPITVNTNNPNYASLDGVLFNKTYTELMQCPYSKTGVYNIPSSVTVIGKEAFSNCDGLTSIVIPSSVKTIGSCAFYWCHGLTGSITIPPSVTTIGDSAFYWCKGLTGSLTIPSSVTSIGSSAFYDCTGFTGSLTIPSSLSTIGNYAFGNCWGFTGSLIIPPSLLTIGDATFDGCSGFTGSLSIPSSVTTIGDYAFSGCSGLTGSLIIPNTTISIGRYAFANCHFNGSLTIPSSITTIEDGAFSGCRSLTGSLSIPSSVTTIGNFAFSNCRGFTGSLTIPSSVTSIKNSAFSGCIGFTGSLSIPSSVTTIGDGAFNGCKGLTNINIPQSVTFIGSKSFVSCGGPIVVNANNPYYSSLDGVLFNKTYTELMQCPTLKTGVYIIPLSVIKLANSAFSNCKSITSITIPSSVKTIEEYTFSGCTGLNSITIPSSINSIKNNAFSFCTGLTSIFAYPTSPIDLSSTLYVFDNVNKVTCTLFVPVNSKSAYQTASLWSDFNNIVEMSGLFISSKNINLSAIADSSMFVDISSNKAWSNSSNQPWLKVSPTSGSGNAKLTFTAETNPATIIRTAIVTISAVGLTNQIITINQAANNNMLTLSASTVNINKTANSTATVGVTSNSTWWVSSNQSWLNVSPINGTGNATLTFIAEANPNATPRTAIVTVSAAGLTALTITIIQEAEATDINTELNDVLIIYPNPAYDDFYVKGLEGIAILELYDLNGRLLLTEKLSSINTCISVSNLSQGLYVIKIKTNRDVIQKKFVKR